jgi:hypothetical protein
MKTTQGAPSKSTTFKRLGPGRYVAWSPECDRVFISKVCGRWRVHLDGGYYAKTWWRKFADAKAEWHDHKAELLASVDERRLSEQAKANDAAAWQHAATAAKLARCRGLDSRQYDPAHGVSWSEWAQVRVGCTAEQVRIECENDRILELYDELWALGGLDDELLTLWHRVRFGSSAAYHIATVAEGAA